MGAYDVMDAALAGLKVGSDSRVGSRRVAHSDGIPYGYPMFKYAGNDKDVYPFRKNFASLVFSADFVASNSITVTVDGVAVGPVVFATDHATTMAAVIAAINAGITGAVAVLDSTDVNGRTISLTIEDGTNRVVSAAVTLGASQATMTPAYSSTMIFDGIAEFVQQEAAGQTELDGTVVRAASNKATYKDAVNCLYSGDIWGVVADAVKSGKAVYVVATAGADQGKLTDETTNNVALTGAVFESTSTGAGLARVRLNK